MKLLVRGLFEDGDIVLHAQNPQLWLLKKGDQLMGHLINYLQHILGCVYI